MTGLDWLGAVSCSLVISAFLGWAANALHEAWPREAPEMRQRSETINARYADRNHPRSPIELYLEGGGDLSAPGVAALLGEAERGWNRNHPADTD